MLLRFEKDRVDLTTREHIFKKILEIFQNKGIATRNEKFDIEQLADYVSESNKILQYLSDRLSATSVSLTIIEITRILDRFENIQSVRPIFEPSLVHKISSADVSDEARYTCLQVIGELGWGSQSQLDQICANIDVSQSENLRAGIFGYINASQIVDHNIDLIIRLSKPLERKSLSISSGGKPSRPAFTSEDFRLADCFQAVKSYQATKKVIHYLKDLTEEHIYEFLSKELVVQFIENAAALAKSGIDERIVHDVIALFESYSRRYMVEYDKAFRSFFENTGNTKFVCDYFYNKRSNEGKADLDNIQALAVLCDNNYLNFIIEEFKLGNLTEDETVSIRWNLSYCRRGQLHDIFHSAINTISGDKYLYLKEDPYTAKLRRQHQVDLALLQDKRSFYERVKQIFVLEEKQQITKEDLSDYRKNYNGDETFLDNTIVLWFIRNYIEEITDEKTVSESTLYNYLDVPVNWENLQICTLLEFDKNNTIQFGEREVQFLQIWLQTQLTLYDFSERITNLHVWIAYFIRRLDYPVAEKTLLNMLRVDYSVFPFKHVRDKKDREETISDYIIRKAGLEAARLKICQNLISDSLDGIEMIIQHAELSVKHELFECVTGLNHQIENKKNCDYYLVKLIESYLKLGGSITKVDQLLQADEWRFKKYDLLRLSDLLIEYDSRFVITYLNKTLNSESYDEETKLYNARLLLKLGAIEGLQFFADCFRVKKKPEMNINRINISKLPGDRALPLFFEILDSYQESGVESGSVFGDDNAILEWVVEIGSQSNDLFEQVREYFHNRIESMNAVWLNYRLQTLEQKYFNRLALSLAIEDAIAITNKAFI